MKKNLLFIILFFIGNLLFGQKEYNIWRGGSRALLDFNVSCTTPIPSFTTLNIQNFTAGGASATICDSAGKLLLSSNGVTVYNADKMPTLNGNNLGGNDNVCQGVLIVPLPGNSSKYYIFRLSSIGSANLSYSIYDMTLDGGLGDIIPGEKSVVFTSNILTEKLTAVRHANGKDIWIIVHEMGNNKFRSYLLSTNGFDVNQTPVVSTIGLANNNGNGYLKANLKGTKIVNADNGNAVWQLYDFNNATGVISNPITLQPFSGKAVYGAEFSPNGKVLYGGSPGASGALQWDITSGVEATINASRLLIGRSQYALQLGPDGKIYVGRGLESNFPAGSLSALDVINYPNCYGLVDPSDPTSEPLCTYVNNGMTWPKAPVGGGPEMDFGNNPLNIYPYVRHSFCISNSIGASGVICKGDSARFNTTAKTPCNSLVWNFGDPSSGANNTSTLANPSHFYKAVGTYTVNLYVNEDSEIDTLTKTVIVSGPIFNLGNNASYCEDDSINLWLVATVSGSASYLWQDSITTASAYLAKTPDTYWVFVKETSTGCMSSDTVEVIRNNCENVITIPNSFTPNGDGKNDFFSLVKVSPGVISVKTIIFDRWGKEVFTTDNIKIEWDGKNKNGNDASDGTYYYIIEYTGKDNITKTEKGFILLLKNNP